MARITPQRRYQRALKVIQKRAGVSYKVAQQAYRNQRDRLGPALPISLFQDYSDGHIRKLGLEAERQTTRIGFEGSEIAFDLKNLSRRGVVPIRPPKVIRKLTVEFTPFKEGRFRGSISVTRNDVKSEDFWNIYHDMAREAIEISEARGRYAEALNVLEIDYGI